MISFFSRHRKVIFIATTSFFLAGIFVGLGGYFYSSRNAQSVATVGGDPVEYKDYAEAVNRTMDRFRDKELEVPPQLRAQIKQQVLNELIVENIFIKSANEYGLKVTDLEVASEIHSNPSFYRNGVFVPELYARAVREVFRKSPEQYEDSRRRARLSMKFRNLIISSAKITPKELEQEYAKRNSGSMAKFEKEKAAFTSQLMQERAGNLMNYYIKKYSDRHEIKMLLKSDEQDI